MAVNFNVGTPQGQNYSPNQSYGLPPALLNLPVTDSTAREMQQGLLNAKETWNNANAYINLYTPYLEDSNDALRQNAQDKIRMYTAQKEGVAKTANQIRNAAKEIGVDMSGFNADDTLEKARQTMYTNDARAMQGLMNLPSVQAQQREYYQGLRGVGLSDRLAQKAAAEKFNQFREYNTAQLFNGLYNYGFNDDGTMNRNGALLMGKLVNENPQMVELFTKQFVSPQAAYAEQNENERLLAQIQANLALKDASVNSARQIAADNNAAQYERERQKRLYDYTKWQEEQNLARQKHQLEVQKFMDNLGYEYDENGNVQRKDLRKVINDTTQRLATIKHFLEKGDFETAKSFIDKYRENLFSDDFKYAEQLDGEDIEKILNNLDVYELVANGEVTLDELNGKQEQPKNNVENSADTPSSKNNQEKFSLDSRGASTDYRGIKQYRNPNPEQHHFTAPGYSGNGGSYGQRIYVPQTELW